MLRQLSLGPEAALSLLIGQMIQDTVFSDSHALPSNPELASAAIALVTTFQVGFITSLLGLLRLGFLDVVLSRALLRGFITAIGVVRPRFIYATSIFLTKQIIFIEQLVPMLGVAQILTHPEAQIEPPVLPIDKLVFILGHLQHTSKATAILGFVSLGILILARVTKQNIVHRPGATWVRYVPEILLVVVGTTGKRNTVESRMDADMRSFDRDVPMGFKGCRSAGQNIRRVGITFWTTVG